MPAPHPVRWIVILLCGALAAFGCASTDTEQGATGSLSLDLVLAGDIEIDVVDWEITGNGMDMGGSIDVSGPGSTASFEVFGLPVGQEPYVVELSAVSVDQQVTCRGSAEFDVEVGVSTPVMVILNCKLPQELGAVRVNGKFNICAQLTKMVVAPLQTSVGNDISLFSTASDEEGDPIAYMWTSHSGSIADPVAASTTYTCTEVGDDDITVLVTDDDGTYCMSMWTVRVTCVSGEGNPCDGVICEDDGNECTDEACNPANGQCETSNNSNACEDDTGTCNAGVCEPNAECAVDGDCPATGNECIDAVCNAGTCGTSNNSNACENDTGTCNAGVCEPNAECAVDGDCPATGNECIDAVCNAGTCGTSNNSNACENDTGTCNAGVCVPDAECAVDGDCPATGNECIDAVCDAGTCGTSNNSNACENDTGTCNAGVCVPNAECAVDGDCPDTGNECVDPVCNAGTCGTSNNSNACENDTGTCDAGVCVPNALSLYAQDFELPMDVLNANALIEDTAAEVPLGPWLFFANVFDSVGNLKFNFGPFGAPNATVSPSDTFISAVVTLEGDVPQGDQQLSVFNDYNCCDRDPITGDLRQGHGNGTDRVEISVFQELNPIPNALIGQTLTFSFDAKRGNIEGATTAFAYIQTLDPSTGFSQTNFVPIELTSIPASWARYSITLALTDPLLEGQILQIGFRNTAQNFEGSGIFYDNVLATLE